MHGGHDVDGECDEAQVFHRSAAWSEKLCAAVGAEAPVVVLAGAVDSFEGFFVEQHVEVVAARNLVHHRHQEQIVVVGKVKFLIYGSQLELVGRHLVVACLGGYAQGVAFDFQIKHESFYPRGNSAEIVVLELLVFGAFVAHQCAACHHQIGTCGVE